MITIHKYNLLQMSDAQDIKSYDEAQFLLLEKQNGLLTLWAKVNTDNLEAIYRMKIKGTGWDLKDIEESGGYKHLSSWQDGSFVWHAFITQFA
jgi:hypothetical protein